MRNRDAASPEPLRNNRRAVEIADQVVPAYRAKGARYSCTGQIARCWQAAHDGAAAVLAAAPAGQIGGRAFALGDRVEKAKGSAWHGRVVGLYSTDLTPVGYAVESEREPGSVQIYPEAALRLATTPSVATPADDAGALHWLADCDNLILFNGVEPDGWWEVRRASVKGEVRGRGPTPLDALRAAMLAASPKAQSVAIGAGEVARLVEPWKDHNGPLPDYDSPIACVFDSGVQYTVELLAKELGVADWTPCDGTEEYDGDLGGTLMNIVREALPLNSDGERMWPSEVAAALAPASASIPADVEREAPAPDDPICASACADPQWCTGTGTCWRTNEWRDGAVRPRLAARPSPVEREARGMVFADADRMQRFHVGDVVSHNGGLIEAHTKRTVTHVLGYDPNGGVHYRLALPNGSDRGLAYDVELDAWPEDEAALPARSPRIDWSKP